jgi:hypothetical protein
VHGDLKRIEINEMPDLVIGYPPKFGPISERPDRGLFALWENPAEAQADNVSEPVRDTRRV